MVPMGFELELSPTAQLVLLLILITTGLAVAVPVTLPLALVGTSRGTAHPGWNGFWYWLWGSALTLAITYGLFQLGLRFWAIPIAWVPGWLLAWLLRVKQHPGTADQQSWARL
ncbi:hypothetical protein FB561_0768 [Kribbella amoyensis]|uniref:Uncharacterized protein n=1 Tax=Kribbella amoyensis TaxID=996641 RepID=A0A561BLE0_9ACTN|nr:hypothetical protein [Kribbella amoyensis]TWD79704.1 hypothetical protein FB561_0768 [Kribbella amoyensis]